MNGSECVKRVGCFKQTKDCCKRMNCYSKDADIVSFILCVAGILPKLLDLCRIV